MSHEISIQLYSVREALAEDFHSTLQRVAELGFAHVEPFGFPARAEEYRASLSELGLSAPSVHAGLVRADDVTAVLDAAAAIGVRTVFEPHVPQERWTSSEDIAATATRLNEIAAMAADRGMAVGYHNHWWELASTVQGRPALEVFADLLDPSVALEVDTYWAEVGGVRAPALLTRLGDRVTHLHIKDGPATQETRDQLPAGQGVVPVGSILGAAPQAVRVVEFDDYDGDIFAGLAASLAYLSGQA